MSLQIREFADSDCATVLSINKAVGWGESDDSIICSKYVSTGPRFSQQSNVIFLVGEVSDNVLGYTVGRQSTKNPEQFYLAFIAVDPKHKNQKIGKALLTELEIRVRELGYRSIQVDCAEDSRGFYEKVGYTVERQMKDGLPSAYRDGKEKYNAAKQLK